MKLTRPFIKKEVVTTAAHPGKLTVKAATGKSIVIKSIMVTAYIAPDSLSRIKVLHEEDSFYLPIEKINDMQHYEVIVSNNSILFIVDTKCGKLEIPMEAMLPGSVVCVCGEEIYT